MTDWRYWVTFSGVVTADTEAAAEAEALNRASERSLLIRRESTVHQEIEVEEIEGTDE
jgi:hypothetical protein